MKKLIFLAVLSLGFMATSQAQEISPNAIGLRLGDSDGFGAEISYQRALGANNRLELDLGWRDSKHTDAFKLTGLYQWVWNLEGNFNWYAGAGGGLGGYDNNKIDDSGAFFFVAGDVGIEYDFDIPLMLSLDFRPELGFTDEYRDGLDLDIALGIRYQF
ncbi:hypothetical protein [Sinomicrobium weinanense]|uniref:Outer membrane protein beta-barrel domain-containing protein n=1 Tax=Sinomicrobium weinanense TaxID=2842200 RepID=A0A926Q427_9FLAO|nr:hypothetical protein [Sinomicrobium weinanense]MBC9796405.1 hypothetical protein [Sinomicrobium weinanense]MBU3122594.1 hypothetical protein [Sinomicrobium weinanense]